MGFFCPHALRVPNCATVPEAEPPHAISELGWEPRRRNVFYELVDDRSDEALETGHHQSTVSIDLPVLASAT